MNIKKKKIVFLNSFKSASDLYRLVMPYNHLIEAGYSAMFTNSIDVKYDRYGNISSVIVPDDWDLIVVARPLNRIVAQILKQVKLLSDVPIVCDIDDDFEEIPRGNKARYLSARNPSQDTNIYWLDMALQYIDMITVTTRKLEERYSQTHKTVRIRNCVLDENFTQDIEKNHERFGWTGNLFFHPTDALSLGDSVRKLTEDGFTFCHVGEGRNRLSKQIGLDTGQFLSMDKSIPYVDYLRYMGNMRVGIAPLDPLPFNDYKSNLKGLENASMGTPCIASPSDAYVEYAEEGGVWLAHDEHEWYTSIKSLMTDDVLYKEVLEQQREVASQWKMTNNLWRWVEAYESIL